MKTKMTDYRMLAPLVKDMLTLKNLAIAVGFTVAVLAAAKGFFSMPMNLQRHITQADSMVAHGNETNRRLDKLICLTAKIETVRKCLYGRDR